MSESRVIVVGSGPAGLMAADRLASAGIAVSLVEKRRAPGRKLLVAGSSGLNISWDSPELDDFLRAYGASAERLRPAFEAFGPRFWLSFIERELGIATFLGTSRRYFVEDMKAAELVRRWRERLEKLGVAFEWGKELSSIDRSAEGPVLGFADGSRLACRACVLALGGGSWEPQEKPLRWPAVLAAHGVHLEPFRPSNVGFRVAWPAALLREAEGKPVKNVVLSSSRGSRSGDLVITKYGIEGTPVYFAGETGEIQLDLKPDLSLEEVRRRMLSVRENLAPIRRAKRLLGLSEGALALLFHMTPAEIRGGLDRLCERIKCFSLRLEGPQPLDEAISSAGGVKWDELTPELMLKRIPGVHLAGEMIDWDAPTGGFLIQACVSTGAFAAGTIARISASAASARDA